MCFCRNFHFEYWFSYDKSKGLSGFMDFLELKEGKTWPLAMEVTVFRLSVKLDAHG